MADKPGAVLVTGANSGIGLATSLLLARRGWETWGTVRSKAKAKNLTDAAKEANVADRVEPVVLDVSDDKAVVRRWSELPDFYAVVNNAGYSELGAVEEVSADSARKQLDVNVIAPAVVSSCALPAMRERRTGRIVMVSSMFGRAAIMPLNGWYHASKFALEALSDVLRMEVAGFGVKVSIVEPGFFKTGIGSDAKTRATRACRRGLPVPQGVPSVGIIGGGDGAAGAAARRRGASDRVGDRERPSAPPLCRRVRRHRPRFDAPRHPARPDRCRQPAPHGPRGLAEHVHLRQPSSVRPDCGSAGVTSVRWRRAAVPSLRPRLVRPGLWSIGVPFPDNPLGYTLVYLIESDRGPVLVDAGWDDDESWDALVDGFRTAGTDVVRVLRRARHPRPPRPPRPVRTGARGVRRVGGDARA